MTGLTIDSLENGIGPLRQQRLGDTHAERLGIATGGAIFGAQQQTAVRLADQTA